MKKVLSVIMAALMLFSVLQFTAVTVLAEETTAADPLEEAPVPEGWTLPGDAAVSGYKPFSHECTYCGETHEGFFGIFITIFHLLLSAVKMGQQAASK
jgi:hypothetical protein